MKPFLILSLIFAFSHYAKADEQYDANCAYLKGIATLNLVGNHDDQENIKPLRSAYRALCRLKHSNNATVNYPNGQMATISYGSGGMTWYYPNGKTITSGNSYSTWYYANGEQISSSPAIGYSVRYPNGKWATSGWLNFNASWYYANGQMITVSAGSKGFSWYHPNGRTLCSSMGNAGATWYDEEGRVLISNGPELSKEELIDVPSVLRYFVNLDEDEGR